MTVLTGSSMPKPSPISNLKFGSNKSKAKRKGAGFTLAEIVIGLAILITVGYPVVQQGKSWLAENEGKSVAVMVSGCILKIDKIYRSQSKSDLTTQVAIDICDFPDDYLDTQNKRTATKIEANGGEIEIEWGKARLNGASRDNAQTVKIMNIPTEQCAVVVEELSASVQDIGVIPASGTSANFDNLKKDSDRTKPLISPAALSSQCNSDDFVTIGARQI